MFTQNRMSRRFAFMLIGVLLLGVTIGFWRIIEFGIDPYTAMNTAVSRYLGISLGTWQLVVNLVLLVPMIFKKRSMIGLGTLVNMVLVGYIIDFTVWVFGGLVLSFAARVVILLMSCVLFCFATALYMTGGLGVAPYDALAPILMQTFKSSFRVTRVITDCTCLALAVIACLLEGIRITSLVGVATIFAALCTGPLVQFFRTRVTQPMLAKR